MPVSRSRKAQIRARARELVAEQNLNRAPIAIERVARALDIAVRYSPLEESLSGMAFIKDDNRVIVLNALHHPNRQRFTLAHEIGHHVLHAPALAAGVHVDKAILRRDDLAAQGTNDFEIEANAFASELLMPREVFETILGQVGDLNDEQQLIGLAARFRVSLAALQLRLAATE